MLPERGGKKERERRGAVRNVSIVNCCKWVHKTWGVRNNTSITENKTTSVQLPSSPPPLVRWGMLARPLAYPPDGWTVPSPLLLWGSWELACMAETEMRWRERGRWGKIMEGEMESRRETVSQNTHTSGWWRWTAKITSLWQQSP